MSERQVPDGFVLPLDYNQPADVQSESRSDGWVYDLHNGNILQTFLIVCLYLLSIYMKVSKRSMYVCEQSLSYIYSQYGVSKHSPVLMEAFVTGVDMLRHHILLFSSSFNVNLHDWCLPITCYKMAKVYSTGCLLQKIIFALLFILHILIIITMTLVM